MYYDSIIIGKGEVGSSIKRVLDKRKKKQNLIIIDKNDKNYKKMLSGIGCRTMHVCYPYSKNFEKQTIKYCKIFEPDLVIIHSTVQVGTTNNLSNTEIVIRVNSYITKELKPDIVHSPVRGKHPELDKGLLTFVKYVGTSKESVFKEAKKEMSNMKVRWIKDSKATELGKILSTSYYGLCIAWHREMNKFCKYFDVDFEKVATDFNITYNEGYKKLIPNVIRPVLTAPKGKIGGHCVSQNAKLLSKEIQSVFLDLIK